MKWGKQGGGECMERVVRGVHSAALTTHTQGKGYRVNTQQPTYNREPNTVTQHIGTSSTLTQTTMRHLTLTLLLVVLMVHIAITSPKRVDLQHVRNKRDVTTRKVRVVSIEHPPYVMQAQGSRDGIFNYSGVFYTGFIPEMIEKIAWRLHLQVDFFIQPDGKYGSMVGKDAWNGMVGEVIKREANTSGVGADIAAAALTITSVREKYVDFIKGFQHHGLTMLIKRPSVERVAWDYTFDVIKPLAPELWAICSAAVILVGLLLWANNRLNPYEHGGRYEAGRTTESAAESFNLQGSLWFAFTSLQWQGFERSPRSLSSKTLTCFWFVFVTLTLVTYTGSLVNHLFWASAMHGKHPIVPEVSTLGQLIKNKDYEYGFVKGGSTQRYFKEVASGDVFDEMRAFWATNGDRVHVKTLEDGVDRVRHGKYVFFMEKYSAEYYTNRKPCDIVTIGNLIAQRSYGFAVPQTMDRQLREDLHAAVLEMMEEGDIAALEKKWWYLHGECSHVSQNNLPLDKQAALYVNKPKVVTVSMFCGPLVLLTVGIILTVIVTIAEIIYFKYRGRYHPSNHPADAKLQIEDEGGN